MKVQTAMSLVGAVCAVREQNFDVHLAIRRGPYVGWNREQLVEDAVEHEVDYLMMIDTDMSFPADGITTLLGRDKDIIGGFYMMKGLPLMNTIKMGEYDPVTKAYTEAVKDWTPPREPFQVAAVATGFLLIRMAAITHLPRPLFPVEYGIGEDIAFCEIAKKGGLEIWCDPTFELRHIGDYDY